MATPMSEGLRGFDSGQVNLAGVEASDESERSMMGFSLLPKILTKSKYI